MHRINSITLHNWENVYRQEFQPKVRCRYYKNAVNQDAGWNQEVIKWCQKEAERRNFKPSDYWGGFVLDEMKIQVRNFKIAFFK